MTDQELREMVREAIARHVAPDADRRTWGPASAGPAAGPGTIHASHGTFAILRSGDADGMCVIEPSVRCNHCGYCLSYGH